MGHFRNLDLSDHFHDIYHFYTKALSGMFFNKISISGKLENLFKNMDLMVWTWIMSSQMLLIRLTLIFGLEISARKVNLMV